MNCGETSHKDGNTQLSENDLTECMPVGVMSVKKLVIIALPGRRPAGGVDDFLKNYVGSLYKNGGLRLERMTRG